MNHNYLTIDFLAWCVANKSFDEQQAKALLRQLGTAIDAAIVNGDDASDLQHAYETILNLISTI